MKTPWAISGFYGDNKTEITKSGYVKDGKLIIEKVTFKEQGKVEETVFEEEKEKAK